MAQEVKIVTFINEREGREQGEEELTRLLNEGWEIKTSGGGTGAEMVWGFVILQREVNDTVKSATSSAQTSEPDSDVSSPDETSDNADTSSDNA